MKPELVEIDYTNYRGERATRIVDPIRIDFTSTQYHPQCQWLLLAMDVEKGTTRQFAMKDIHSWKPLP